MLRLRHRRVGVALVVSHGVHRPDCAGGRALPQERRGPLLRVLLSGRAVLQDQPGIALFDAVVRSADSTGIVPEDARAELSADLREDLGIEDYAGGG